MEGKENKARSPDQFTGRYIEQKENPELFRATLGFDFVFCKDVNQKKTIKCVEINGEKSGISGIADIPRISMPYVQKLLAEIRSRHSAELEAVQLKHALGEDLRDTVKGNDAEKIFTFLQQLDKRKQEIRTITTFKHAYKNPIFIESIANDKVKQQQYIPQTLAPRVARNATDLEQCSEWIVKPVFGSRGEDISVLGREEIKRILQMMEDDGVDSSIFFTEDIVQELVEPLGADNADEKIAHNPASLRLLVDFRYMNKGEIQLDYVAGYQRVSRHSIKERGVTKTTLRSSETGEVLQEFDLDPEQIYVVNKATGALSVAMSETERTMALEAAKSIITNLAEAYRSQTKSALP